MSTDVRTITTDIAVIGAGIIGCATAAALAAAGRRVCLVDAVGPAAGASGACDGFLSVSTKIPGLMMEMATASRALWPAFAAGLGLEVNRCGGLMLAEDRSQLEAIAAHGALLTARDVPARIVEAAELRRIEPAAAPDLAGGLECPDEIDVTPYRVVARLAAKLRTLGVECLWPARVIAVDLDGDRLRSVRLEPGIALIAEQWVVATGAWSAELGLMIGLPLPVEPRRGDLLVTERGRQLSPRFLVSASYLTNKLDPDASRRPDAPPMVRLGYGFTFEPTPYGQHVIGGTRVFGGFERATDHAAIALIAREARRWVPAVADLPILRAWTGFRPFVPDKKPLIGRSRLRPNLVVATGHEGDGITLAPLTARLVAELVDGQSPSFALEALDPDRFATPPERVAA